MSRVKYFIMTIRTVVSKHSDYGVQACAAVSDLDVRCIAYFYE